MAYQDTELVFLFFFYSFTGWVLETTIASISFKTFKNRGFLSGSFCLMYGLIGVAVSITFKDLRGSVVLLFLGCFLMTVLIQWITAIFLEWIGHGKWWNYSHSFLHLNEYISVPIAAALGAVGVMAVLFINDLMIGFFRLIPEWLTNLFLLSLIALTAFDLVISFITVHCRGKQKNKIAGWNRILSGTTGMLGKRISTFMIKRLEKAYPELCREADQDTGQDAAEGIPDQKAPAIPSAAWRLSFFDYFWFFVAGALIGDFVETIFMWLVYGKWMSRSSLVWGSFSIVWGVAMVLCFLLIGRGGRHSDAFCFISGTLFGGTFEYFCSIFSELAFGAVFWDYSSLSYNVEGRINLLYCFFWGFACVIFNRWLIPLLLRVLQTVRGSIIRYGTPFMAFFLAADILFSGIAIIRYRERKEGIEPRNGIAIYFDLNYDDEVMLEKYPGLKWR